MPLLSPGPRKAQLRSPIEVEENALIMCNQRLKSIAIKILLLPSQVNDRCLRNTQIFSRVDIQRDNTHVMLDITPSLLES